MVGLSFFSQKKPPPITITTHILYMILLNTSPLSIWCNLYLMCVNLILLNFRILN
jgi:hypothetical protein